MQDPTQQPQPSISAFRLLLHRAISVLWQEEAQWEQELLNAAIEDSLNTYTHTNHETMFSSDPHRKIKLNETDLTSDTNEECHLCLEDMRMGDKVIILPCRHFFHSSCIRELVEHRHVVCPLCRQSIPIEEEIVNE